MNDGLPSLSHPWSPPSFLRALPCAASSDDATREGRMKEALLRRPINECV